jgi:hypothetical protein
MNHFYFSIQLIVLIILGVFTQSTLAQDITQTGMEVDKKQQKIFVNYRITDPSPIIYEYDIQLYYSQDAGLNYQGPLQYLEGHYGTQIIADPQKTIAWNYLQENPNFYGINVRFKISATFRKSVLNLKSTEGALYSLVVPGWGNSKVRFLKHRYRWLGITLPTYAMVGTGILLDIKSKQNYEAYQQALNFEEANPLYEKANEQRKWSRGLLWSGGILWLGDILQVAWKGMKNKKEKKQILEKNNTFSPQIGLKIAHQSGTTVGSLSLKF